jgi:competence protein ComGC
MNRQLIESEIGLELPNIFEKYDKHTQESIINYLKKLDKIERQAYTIGKSHLGSSFNLLKSNGYLDWKKNSK